jgi:8-oxo-dGTP pyrophosphatase MutT (NUDIX family)
VRALRRHFRDASRATLDGDIVTNPLRPELGKRVYAGIIFDTYRRVVPLPSGGVIEWETVACADVVRVYPVTESGEIFLIHETRPGEIRPTLRVVSGRIDPDETPTAAAARELGEEIGMQAGHYFVFATSQPMLKVRHRVHHVLARCLSPIVAQPELGERVEAVCLSVKDATRRVWNGEICEDVIAFNLLRLDRILDREDVPE